MDLKDLSTRKCEHQAVYREVFHFLVLRGLFHEHILDLCLSYNLSYVLSKKVRMT